MNIRTGGGVLASPIVKAVLDSLGVSYVIEQGQDESGNWYRRFSNGWVEQGGIVSNPSLEPQLTFPIEFSNTDYDFSAYPKTGHLSGDVYIWQNAQTTTGLKIHMGGGESPASASWEAKGFAA